MRASRKSKGCAGRAKNAPLPKPLDDAQFNAAMRRVCAWMWVGLGITATVASAIPVGAFFPSLASLIVLVVALLTAAVALDRKLRHFSPVQAGAFFVFYAALTGVALANIFSALNYPQVSGTLSTACHCIAILFGLMTLIGWRTGLDFGRRRSYFLMALLGLLIAFAANRLQAGAGFDYIFSYFSVLLFTALAEAHRAPIDALSADPGTRVKPADGFGFSLVAALKLYVGAGTIFLWAVSVLWGGSWRHHHLHHLAHQRHSNFGGIGSGGAGGFGDAGGADGAGQAGGDISVGGGGSSNH